MFSNEPTSQAGFGRSPENADEIAHLIDRAHEDMRGPGTALGLGHALRTALPPSATSENGRRRSRETQEEEAERVFREVSSAMTLVYEGEAADTPPYVQGDPESLLEAVVLTLEDDLWIARGSQAATMGGSGWETERLDAEVAEVIAETLAPEHAFKSDLPEEDPDVVGAIYLDDGDLTISEPDEGSEEEEEDAES